MKQIFVLLVFSLVFISCKQTIIEKPDDLIPPDKMEKVLYDLSLITAIKGVDIDALQKNNINPQEYLLKKYQIDSAQFSNSSVYYAAKNPEEYAKIFDKIKDKLQKEQKRIQDSINIERQKNQAKTDSLSKKSKKSSTPKKPILKSTSNVNDNKK
ncbi:protein of unknown function [Pustulibacterium marinum]|uniref:DUF4296 domain-containing protein n=1 Tax=Pustulibacterium marinum TaxID=1224947 RepID=A0A1I7EY05_9FLAO|nr:DUF4296 domain-containing protein [Pustulibacterium marinum]SFU28796.1 protein of unknown function [Pustulibacterium marinum]